MTLKVHLTECDIRGIIANHLNNVYHVDIKPEELPIRVKSKQNWKSEWEEAAFQCEVDITRTDV